MDFRFVIYGAETCQHCREAARMLRDKNLAYRYIHIDDEEHFTTDDLKHLVTEIAPGARTIPIVLVDGKWIGGKTDLEQYLKENP